MKVLKFGGSSVSTADNFARVSDIILNEANGSKIVVVLSASGDTTDILQEIGILASEKDKRYHKKLEDLERNHIDIINNLISPKVSAKPISYIREYINKLGEICGSIYSLGELSDKTRDNILSFGELFSTLILANHLESKNLKVKLNDSSKIIITNSDFSNAKIDFDITNNNIVNSIDNSDIFIFQGFISSNSKGITTTLGRGGSDYTASVIAAALDSEELQIWTDVNGVMTADPRIVKTAKTIENINYKEATEMSHLGAKVIYSMTMKPVQKKEIPIFIKNTFDPKGKFTLISKNNTDNNVITGITSVKNISLISMYGTGMVGVPGFSNRFLRALSDNGINVSLVTQGSSESSITAAILNKDSHLAEKFLKEEFSYEIDKGFSNILLEKDMCMVAIVGNNMRHHHGISGKMFSALGKNAINIKVISQGSSEMNITAVISKKNEQKAISILHEEFFDNDTKKLNLFVVGVGTVGGSLLSQIQNQKKNILENNHISMNIVGLANSKKMVFNPNGVSVNDLPNGDKMAINEFVKTIKNLNVRNSVFVDNTASSEVSDSYEYLLQNGISVVTCNKIAASSDYLRYKKLNDLAKEYNSNYLYETNVGAGLPIIGTLKDLIKTGDKVTEIKAVLSGSLNFIFNEFKENTRFVDVVRQAMKEGYTEPDPRIDLSGVDVMRKILILVRESGLKVNLEDIKNNEFLDKKYFSGSVDDFLKTLGENDDYFNGLREKASQNNCKLKFVASFKNGQASVGLEEIPKNSPLYNLDGKDNIVMFYTNRYIEQPMIIKGAGAGAEVTASGIFADIMRTI